MRYQRRGISHGTRVPLSCSTRSGRSRSPRDIFPNKPGSWAEIRLQSVFEIEILGTDLIPVFASVAGEMKTAGLCGHAFWSLDPDAGSCARACVVAPLMPLRCHHRPPSSYLRSAKENAVRPRQLFHSLRGGSTFSQCIAMPTVAFSGAGYRQHDFSPGQPAFGHDACGGAHRLFTQPCNGLYTSRISPCAGRKQHRSWFGLGDRESSPNCHPFHLTAWPYRIHLYP